MNTPASMEETVRTLVRAELSKYDAAFEDRLADAMQRALDTVLSEYERRIRYLEEDMADVLKHLGML